MREIPGLRKRERTWKDEVRERVRHRRQQRGGGEELPLFRDEEEPGASEPDPEVEAEAAPERAAPQAAYGSGLRELGEEFPRESLQDLPLRRIDASEPDREQETEPEPEPPHARADRFAAAEPEADEADEEGDHDYEREWRLDAATPAAEARPVERPAYAAERAQAALVDFLLMVSVWAVVVYFSGRAARVGLTGLAPAWPYLLAYLAFLGIAYATCFTGITGQTLGKMLKGLRVVNAAGRPPGCPRAFLRAVLGTVGVALAFSGVVPVFFDPARRALHDRLLKTRVVKS